MRMNSLTKISLVGLATSVTLSIVFGVIEIKDARKGKRRLHKADVELIADSIITKQKEEKKAKREAAKKAKAVIKEV